MGEANSGNSGDLRQFRYQQIHEAFRYYDSTLTLLASISLPLFSGLYALSFASGTKLLSVIALFLISIFAYCASSVLYRRQNSYTRPLSDMLQEMEGDDFIRLYTRLEKIKPFDIEALFAVGFVALIMC